MRSFSTSGDLNSSMALQNCERCSMLSHFDATAHDVNIYRDTKGAFELTAEVATAEIDRAHDFCNCETRVEARPYELDHPSQLPSQKAHGGCPQNFMTAGIPAPPLASQIHERALLSFVTLIAATIRFSMETT